MPTILRHRGFAFRLYSNDHPPPHVHVVGTDGWALVEIGSGRVFRQRGVSPKVLAALVAVVMQNRNRHTEAWDDIHERR
jgi:hypothetical protein